MTFRANIKGAARTIAAATCALLVPLAALGLSNEAFGPGYITPLGDVLLKAGMKVPVRVASNADLKLYRYGGVVHRNGFSAAGDGGDAIYTHANAACSLNAGAGDDGAQVRGADGKCWNADLSKPISAAVWGVKSDCVTDDQPSWSAAVRALGALNGGGTLLMPSRPTCSKLNSTFSIQTSSVKIVGSGEQASTFGINFPTGNGIEIGGNPIGGSTYTKNVTLEHLAVNPLVAHTSGASLLVYRAVNTHALNFRCAGDYAICADIEGAMNGHEDTLDTELSFYTASGVNKSSVGVCMGCLYVQTATLASAAPSGSTQLTLSSTAGFYVGGYVSTPVDGTGAPTTLSNNPITAISGNTITVANATGAAMPSGQSLTESTRAPISTVFHHLELTYHGVAEKLQQVGGLVQDDINTDFNFDGLLMGPQAGQAVSGIFSTNANYDANGNWGMLFGTSGGGLVYSNTFNNQWVASCGSPITIGPDPAHPIVPGTSVSSCIGFVGPPNTNFNNNLLGLHVGAATAHCIQMDSSARDIIMQGELTSCAFYYGGTYHGIYSNGATHWSWNGTIGTASNVPGVYPQGQQYSIYLTGATDYVRISGDLGRDASGIPIFNNATGTNFSYDGVLPALPWIAFTPAITCGSGAPGSGAVAGLRYRQAGKTISYSAQVGMGTSSTCVGMKFSLPFAPAFGATGSGGEISNTVTVGGFGGLEAWSWLQAGAPIALTQYSNSTATGGNNTSNTGYVFTGTFEMQ